MCVRIRRLQSHKLAVSQTRQKLTRIETECKEAVTGVLDNVRDAASARAILLSQVRPRLLSPHLHVTSHDLAPSPRDLA